jgi:hypothetical protein
MVVSSSLVGRRQGTMQVSVMVAVCSAVMVTVRGCEHGSSRPGALPLPAGAVEASSMFGDRPETWYLPGGSQAENLPEAPTVIVTRLRPAAVKVTVPGMGRSPGCCPPGLIGPPSMTNLPVKWPVTGTCWLVEGTGLAWPAVAHPASAAVASRQAQVRATFMVLTPKSEN